MAVDDPQYDACILHATGTDYNRSLETDTFVLPHKAYYATKIPIE